MRNVGGTASMFCVGWHLALALLDIRCTVSSDWWTRSGCSASWRALRLGGGRIPCIQIFVVGPVSCDPLIVVVVCVPSQRILIDRLTNRNPGSTFKCCLVLASATTVSLLFARTSLSSQVLRCFRGFLWSSAFWTQTALRLHSATRTRLFSY